MGGLRKTRRKLVGGGGFQKMCSRLCIFVSIYVVGLLKRFRGVGVRVCVWGRSVLVFFRIS